MLQVFLTTLGSVAVVSGLVTMLWGAGSVAGVDVVTAELDNEMRFFAVWYAAAGVVILRAISQVESAGSTVRAIGGLFFIAGCGRLISIAVVGTPHPIAMVLMCIELALPFVIVPWQAAVARQKPSAV